MYAQFFSDVTVTKRQIVVCVTEQKYPVSLYDYLHRAPSAPVVTRHAMYSCRCGSETSDSSPQRVNSYLVPFISRWNMLLLTETIAG
jgi:hypothetical protein